MRAVRESNHMTSPFALQDEIALITGGGTGVGLGIAQAMLAAGAKCRR